MGDHGLIVGKPDLKSIGPITFGPDGVLFVADNVGAKVFAIDVDDVGGTTGDEPFELENLDSRLSGFLGCNREDVSIRGMDVHPSTHNVYLSVSRGNGNASIPLIVKIDSEDGSFSDVPLKKVAYSQVEIQNAPDENDEAIDMHLAVPGEPAEEMEVQGHRLRISKGTTRSSTVTDMAYIDGTLLVAGMSNEEFSSNLRRVPFPFTDEFLDNSLEIFHVSHGQYETAAPIRTFVPYGGNGILASYTCTPLVQFSLSDLKSGSQAKGKTVADLGAMNQPIDMITFTQASKEYLLVSNVTQPLMKIACKDIDQQTALTEPKEPVGVPYEALSHQGVTRLAKLNGDYALMMQWDEESGERHLRSYGTASL